jgi:hypothetical protein
MSANTNQADSITTRGWLSLVQYIDTTQLLESARRSIPNKHQNWIKYTTLERLVCFNRINDGEMRFSVGAKREYLISRIARITSTQIARFAFAQT